MSYDITLQNGVQMPQIGLGTYQLKGNMCQQAIHTAINNGYRHLDTAEAYNNEEAIGEALQQHNRDDIFITSKVWRTNLHHDEVITACEESLDRLQTEYIDLYLIHWPNKNVPMEETFNALQQLYEEEKIRAVGVSNFTISHLEEAMDVADVPITVNQVEYHPFLYQENLRDYCDENNITLTAYCPIARNKVANDPTIQAIADKHDKTPAQVALRWIIQQGIVAIPRSSKDKHIKENMNIFDFELSDPDMERIGNAPRQRLIKPDFAEFDR